MGEITSRSKTYQNLLLFQDVTLHKYQSGQATVNLKMSYFKHNTSKLPVILEIKSQAKDNYCPVRKLRELFTFTWNIQRSTFLLQGSKAY